VGSGARRLGFAGPDGVTRRDCATKLGTAITASKSAKNIDLIIDLGEFPVRRMHIRPIMDAKPKNEKRPILAAANINHSKDLFVG